MTKTELIAALANQTGSTKTTAEKHLNAFIVTVKETLKKGDSVNLTGFGSFNVSDRKKRNGRNPQTGQAIEIPAKKAPKFTPGIQLKEVVA